MFNWTPCTTILFFIFFLITGVLVTLYFTRGLLNCILSFLFLIILNSCLLFIIDYTFVAIWLFIIYGGANIMFIMITTALIKYEIFETTTFKYYKDHLITVLTDLLILSIPTIHMFYLHDVLFESYNHSTPKKEVGFWLISNYLFNYYGNLVIAVGLVLFLILVSVLDIQSTERVR